MAEEGRSFPVWSLSILATVLIALGGIFLVEYYILSENYFQTEMIQQHTASSTIDTTPSVATESQTAATEENSDGATDTNTSEATLTAEPAESTASLAGTTEASNATVTSENVESQSQSSLLLPPPPAKHKSINTFLASTDKESWHLVNPLEPAYPENSWNIIFIQNKYRINSLQIPKHLGAWNITAHHKKIRVEFNYEKSERKDILARKNKGKYAVQLMSLEEKFFKTALDAVTQLTEDGYYAYLYRTPDKFKKRYWYRVRVGFFKTPDEAKAAGAEIHQRYRSQGLFPKTYWSAAPSTKELNTELVSLKVQQNKPWMIEMKHYENEEEALKDFSILSKFVDFSSLSFKDGSYRIQIGFFETKSAATSQLKTWKRWFSKLKTAYVVKTP